MTDQLQGQMKDYLPVDHDRALLVGRVWAPGALPGPAIVVIRKGEVFDITATHPVMSELLAHADLVPFLLSLPSRKSLGSAEDILVNSVAKKRDPHRAYFIAPIDLQAIKACGVTFAESLIERVIEEQCKGDARRAKEVRALIESEIGNDLRTIRPRTPQAARLKDMLLQRNLWSQYLEVGIGPDAEVFTKSQPMSAVGLGAEIGIHPDSEWNNPEPEVVLIVNPHSRIVGCTLGNDVNLRDVEGRSALLLGRAKDNNASCALGPFIRLVDDHFTLDELRALTVRLEVTGPDGFTLGGESSLSRISRDIEDLVKQASGAHHQYPDGFALFTGTMFAPTKDRDVSGLGFTHKIGDCVRISSPRLGCLENCVQYSTAAEPWSFGIGALMRNLAQRGYLTKENMRASC
jgi:fumarylacetoacetate (FAA) hydrolase family protein